MRAASLVAAILATALSAAGAKAQSGALAACGAPGESAERAAHFCRMALGERGLTPRQRELAGMNLGAALLDLGDADGAAAAYDAAIAGGGAEPWAWAGRARARETQGRIAEAAQDWAKAVSLGPRDAGLRAAHGAFLLRGGDAEGALAQFDAGLAIRRGDAGLGYNRALALAALGRDAEADAALTAVLRDHPDDIGARLTRGRLRAEQDPARGLPDLDEAVKRAGEWPAPHFARAQALDRLGRRAEADRDYRRAWELGMRDEALNARMLEIGR